MTNLDDGIKVLEDVNGFIKEIERVAKKRTGKRCPQVVDMALTKPSRNAFSMTHQSFTRMRDQLSTDELKHLLTDWNFSSFTTLDVESFFSSMRTPSRPTPDMADYAKRRPSCIAESIDKLYQSSFLFYTGPQSHYSRRSVSLVEPKWLGRVNLTERATSNEDDDPESRAERSREMRTFVRDFGRGVRQQRTRAKTKERSGTLPLAISMSRKAHTTTEIDLLAELQEESNFSLRMRQDFNYLIIF